MVDLNRVMLIGRLTADPDAKVVKTGNSVTTFSLAVNRKWRKEGVSELQEEVTFVDVEAWGRSGEAIKKYFTKGRTIFIEGRLRLDRWQEKETQQKRSRMKVVAERFSFLPDGKFTPKNDDSTETPVLPVPTSAPVIATPVHSPPVAVGAGMGGGGGDDHIMRMGSSRLVADPMDTSASSESFEDQGLPF